MWSENCGHCNSQLCDMPHPGAQDETFTRCSCCRVARWSGIQLASWMLMEQGILLAEQCSMWMGMPETFAADLVFIAKGPDDKQFALHRRLRSQGGSQGRLVDAQSQDLAVSHSSAADHDAQVPMTRCQLSPAQGLNQIWQHSCKKQ